MSGSKGGMLDQDLRNVHFSSRSVATFSSCPSVVPSEERLVKTGGTNLGNMGCSTLPRFCFFHSFFEKKKPTSQIPETEQQFSFPMEGRAREVVSNAFFRWAVGSVGEV